MFNCYGLDENSNLVSISKYGMKCGMWTKLGEDKLNIIAKVLNIFSSILYDCSELRAVLGIRIRSDPVFLGPLDLDSNPAKNGSGSFNHKQTRGPLDV